MKECAQMALSRSEPADLAVIGASLLGITKALMAAPVETARIYEAHASIGGCWDNAEGLGFEQVENGTHVFFHDRQDRSALYGVMERVLGAELYDMTPFPHVCFNPSWPIYPLEGRQNGRLVGMHRAFAEARSASWRLTPWLRGLRYGSKFLWSLVHYHLLGDRRSEMFRYRYVKGGMPTLMESIEAKIADEPAVSVELNAAVRRVVYDGPEAGYRIVLANGREDRARGVMLTAGSRLSEIEDRAQGRVIPLPHESNVTQHINFVLREPGSAKAFSFVEFFDRPRLRWLTDITDFARPAITDGRRMCCVRLHGSIDPADLDLAMEEIVGDLRAAGYLSSEAQILDKMILSYRSSYRNDQLLKEINAALPPGAKMYYSRYFFKSLLRLFESEPELLNCLSRGPAERQTSFAAAAE